MVGQAELQGIALILRPPTIATDAYAAKAKSISWRIVRVPVESRTCLVTCSTMLIGLDMRMLVNGNESKKVWRAL